MSTTFDINRLGLTLKRYFIENKQRELTFWGIAIFVFMLFPQNGTTQIFLLIAGVIYVGSPFQLFNNTPRGIQYLSIPASHIEKLTATLLIGIIYYFAMGMITYVIGSSIGTYASNIIFGTNNTVDLSFFQTNTHYNTLNGVTSVYKSGPSIFEAFSTFILIQSIFILGSIYFKNNTIGKTILTLIAISFALGMLEALALKIIFGTYHLEGRMFNLTVPFGENLFPGAEIIGTAFKYALIPFLWVVTYFRLTEKEV